MKKTTLPILLLAASIVLAILSFFILPESVVIQFSVGSSGNTAVPRFVGILIPFALGAGGAVSELLPKENAASKNKGLLVSLVGIALFLIMIAVNCIMK